MSGPSATAKRNPSAFVQSLIARANRPHEIVPFPLVDHDGKPVAMVHVRGLSQGEEDLAFANAQLYAEELLKSPEQTRWRPEDLEQNARASEVLAVCCRKVDDPTQPFFEHGVVDTREFETEVLGQLFNAYCELKEKFYPRISTLTKEEFEAWIALIAEGAEALPFHSYSRTQLEALCRSAVTCLVDARATILTLTDSSGSDS